MIIVTGGAGFIGSRLVRSLVGDGHEVVVVDDATGEGPGGTLHGVDVEDHVGQEAFRAALARPNALRGVDVVLHQGACSDTTEADETFLWDNNVRYSVSVLDACQRDRVPLVYASSAAVHGRGVGGEDPLNGYARSKAAVDAVVRERTPGRRAPIVGLRYFNVYGPGERHKGPMASMVLQVDDQIRSSGVARLFGAGEGAEAGQHRRGSPGGSSCPSTMWWRWSGGSPRDPTAAASSTAGPGRAARSRTWRAP